MLHRLKNLLLSLRTYGLLSPDIHIRWQVDRTLLCYRSKLTCQEWFTTLCQPCGISQAIAEFGYTYLAYYSGLAFERVRLSDRLEEDLHWTEVCWFDWEIALCEDFFQSFGVDMSDRLEQFNPKTIEDILRFLDYQQQEDLSQSTRY